MDGGPPGENVLDVDRSGAADGDVTRRYAEAESFRAFGEKRKDRRFNGGIWFDLKAEVSKNTFRSNWHGSHGSDVRHGNNGGERVRFKTRRRTRHMYLANYIRCSQEITADRKQGADNWHM